MEYKINIKKLKETTTLKQMLDNLTKVKNNSLAYITFGIENK